MKLFSKLFGLKKRPKAFCNLCGDRSKEKVQPVGSETVPFGAPIRVTKPRAKCFVCQHPNRTTTRIDYVTGETHFCYRACSEFNSRGQCKLFWQPKKKAVEK